MTATLHTEEGRSVLRFERELRHSPERVWRAVTDPGELAQWFPAEVVYEPRVGAPMQFDFGGEHGLDAWPGEVLEWDPPRVFAFAWGEEVLRFEVSPSGDGTRLVFTHTFDHQPGKPAGDAAGWEACFEAFDALLAGEPAEAAEDNWAAHHARYVEQFGEVTIVDGGAHRPVRRRGPYVEVDGRPAVSVVFDDRPGVLVVREDGQPLAHGVEVEIREGDAQTPGEVVATGVLHDPLVAGGPR